MDNFLLLNFKSNRQDKNFIENNIYAFDTMGFEVDDPVEKKALLDELPEWELSDLQPLNSELISYGVYFTDDSDGMKNMESLIDFFKEHLQNFNYETKHIDNSNWEEEWKKTYTAFPIGEKIWIKPSWEEEIPEGKIVIEIEPKTAFGTGTHETTSLCMEYVEDEDFSGRTILDIGCGSGILSILASKLGASHIDACDIDEFAIANAKDNARINKVDNLNVFYSDLFSQVNGTYDLIFANILAEILVQMLEDADRYLNENGRLILSGILDTKVDLVRSKLEEKGYRILDQVIKGEWALIAACK